MKSVLVTGANGFIGQYAIKELLSRGYIVHAVYSNKIKGPLDQKNLFWHQADLLLQEDRRKLLQKIKVSHLLHLAWYAVPGLFWTAKENEEWVKASEDLFRMFIESGGRRATFAGSCAEIEWPNTLYGQSKLALSKSVQRMGLEANVPTSWGRVFFLYGPGEPKEKLVSSVITSLLNKNPIPCTEGTQIRDFLHIEDVARAFVSILESKESGPINIGSGIGVSIKDLVSTIGKITGESQLLKFGEIPMRAGEPPNIIAEISKLRALGFQPKFDLESGLRNTIEWWKSNV